MGLILWPHLPQVFLGFCERYNSCPRRSPVRFFSRAPFAQAVLPPHPFIQACTSGRFLHQHHCQSTHRSNHKHDPWAPVGRVGLSGTVPKGHGHTSKFHVESCRDDIPGLLRRSVVSSESPHLLLAYRITDGMRWLCRGRMVRYGLWWRPCVGAAL